MNKKILFLNSRDENSIWLGKILKKKHQLISVNSINLDFDSMGNDLSVPDMVIISAFPNDFLRKEIDDIILNLRGNIYTFDIPILIFGKPDQCELILDIVSEHADDFILNTFSEDEIFSIVSHYTSKKEILIADDDIISLETLKVYLEDNYKTSAVSSGQQVLNYLVFHRPDLIILDYSMPKMNGLVTMELIRNKDDCENIPIIVMTGSTEKNTIVEILADGASDYCVKPIKRESLLESVETLLNKP